MFTISTAKGEYTAATLEGVCEWQAKMQGSYASITSSWGSEVDVDAIDFDPEDIATTVKKVSALFQGTRVETGTTMATYTTGSVLEVTGDHVTVNWDSRPIETVPAETLRQEGEDTPPSFGALDCLKTEAELFDDQRMVELCSIALNPKSPHWEDSMNRCWRAIRHAQAQE